MASLITLDQEEVNRAVRKSVETAFELLTDYHQPKKSLTGLISKKELQEELDIAHNTIIRWESLGLKRYTPPINDSRTVFYKISELLGFLGVEE
ncbi:hypothetical protein J2T50_001379 [Streptococcus gallinaceus]|uniref:hypothetical protein n=1 Tax=Streptococcus gallinaceus TaxID=165758 RepID=UPI00209D30EA|nr:hypothetical protein [Streptococcus gallinaceus]MCP1639670.1 hypothetical protein [Streptococcus gallinaceus]MCP1770453.1 hypothetical protein [Streptococcus gallinaceus]